MKTRQEVFAERQPWSSRIQILLLEHGERGSFVASPVQMQDAGADRIPEPTMSLNLDTAQQLMDELWRCGLRPTEGTGSAGSLAATERHLADMKAITFGLLRKDGVTL